MNKYELLKLLYVTKDYKKLKSICVESEDDLCKRILGKVFFLEGNYKDAARVFYLQKMFYESGYSLLMQGDLYNARRLWETLAEDSPLVNWGKALLGFIEKKNDVTPTYFQIRNFLEQDLDALLSANLITYAENVINSIEVLAAVNSESYKYIARVLYNHAYYDIAKNFLLQSKEIYYKDPETHFLLAKIHLFKKEKEEAIKALNIALDVNDGYFPAENLLQELVKKPQGLKSNGQIY